MADRLAHSMSDLLFNRLTDCLAGSLTNSLTASLTHSLAHLGVDGEWLADCSIDEPAGNCLIDGWLAAERSID